MSQQEDFGWKNVIARVALNALSHPVEYAKILIQIGHEPLPTYSARTIFGREKMYYPSIFKYISHIRQEDGFFGCYRGLSAKLGGNITGGLVFQKITENIHFSKYDDRDLKTDNLTVDERTQRFVQCTIRETAGRVGAIVVSQPFHVIAIRMMAEFVGEEGIYTGVFQSVRVIYKEEGISGFFSGLIPRLICDIGAVWIGNSIIHILNNYAISEFDTKEYTRIVVRFITTALMYPFQVVANCMAVTNSGLIAGSPPYMPHYEGWYSCYNHLRSINGLKRGSSLIWRAYSGPVMLLSNGPVIPNQAMFTSFQKID